MRALLLVVLVACGGSDSPSTPEDIAMDTNADRVTCTAWPGTTDCADVCDPKPTDAVPMGWGCPTAPIKVINDVPGFCFENQGRVDWVPCGKL